MWIFLDNEITAWVKDPLYTYEDLIRFGCDQAVARLYSSDPNQRPSRGCNPNQLLGFWELGVLDDA